MHRYDCHVKDTSKGIVQSALNISTVSEELNCVAHVMISGVLIIFNNFYEFMTCVYQTYSDAFV